MSMAHRKWQCFLVLLALAPAISLATHGTDPRACTIAVRPGESIQDAVDRAPPGAVVCLAAGTWTEEVVVAKALTICGDPNGRSVVRCPTSALAAVMAGTFSSEDDVSVSLKDLRIVGTGQGLYRPSGAIACDTAHIDISHCEIVDCERGIVTYDAATARIPQCTIRDCRAGVSASSCAVIAIAECEISQNSWHGVVAMENVSLKIEATVIERNGQNGLLLFGTSDTLVTQSAVRGTTKGWGIQLGGAARVELQDCEISGNSADGIGLTESSEATVESCVIHDNRNGIRLYGSSSAVIEGSHIFGNYSYGVSLSGGFSGYVGGKRNEVSGSERSASGPVYPRTLAFLATEQGGELDLRL